MASGFGEDSHYLSPPLVFFLDKYAVRFIPRENGLYLIDVKFNGSHIPGSPFKIRVGETGQAGDPGMVSAYGQGLEGGTTGNALPLCTTKQNKMKLEWEWKLISA